MLANGIEQYCNDTATEFSGIAPTLQRYCNSFATKRYELLGNIRKCDENYGLI